MPCLKPSLEQKSNLGPDAARARNRRSLSAARCAGRGGIGKTLEPQDCSKVPALHREAERDTTGSFSRQPLLHTWIGRRVQVKRRPPATLGLIRRRTLKQWLTLWFYYGKRAARRHRFVGEPRKSLCFAELRAVVRRSIALFPGRHWPRDRRSVIETETGIGSSRGLGRPPGR